MCLFWFTGLQETNINTNMNLLSGLERHNRTLTRDNYLQQQDYCFAVTMEADVFGRSNLTCIA